MHQQRVRQGKDQRPKERSRSADRFLRPAEGAQQQIHAQPSPKQMGDRCPLQRLIRKIGGPPKEQQVVWVEKTRLDVADKRRTAVQRWIPEWKNALRQGGCRKTIGRKQKTGQIAAIRWLVDISAQRPPEKTCDEQPEQPGSQHICPKPCPAAHKTAQQANSSQPEEHSQQKPY